MAAFLAVGASLGWTACGGRADSGEPQGAGGESGAAAGGDVGSPHHGGGKGGSGSGDGGRPASATGGRAAAGADGADDSAGAGGYAQGGADSPGDIGGMADGGASDGAGGGAGEGGSPMAGAGAGGAGGEQGCAAPVPVIGNLRVPRDYATIQAAIVAAVAGDTISVARGTYQENIDFSGKAVRLVSEQGAAGTIIDGNHQGPVVTFQSDEGRNSILEGFTLRNGLSAFEGGVSLRRASPTIARNVFVDNQQGSGGFGAGIGGNVASPWIEANFFANNSCDDQFLSGVLAFVNDSSPVIVNNVFLDNACRAIDITIPEGPQPVVSNNTIVNNHMGIHVDARVTTSLQSFTNNIVVGGDVGLEVVFAGQDPLFTWSHNLVYGNTTDFVGIADPTGTNGNVAFDPQLTDIQGTDLHLLPTSPAIDAGVLSGSPPTHDFDGDARVIDGDDNGSAQVDIGADEYSAATCRAVAIGGQRRHGTRSK